MKYISAVPTICGPHAHLGQQVFSILLTAGDLLDVHAPNLERRFMLDLLMHCQITTDDVLELGLHFLTDLRTVPVLQETTATLQTLIGELSLSPITPLQA